MSIPRYVACVTIAIVGGLAAPEDWALTVFCVLLLATVIAVKPR